MLTSKVSLEEFEAWPEREPAVEWVRGEVVSKPLPNELHAVLAAMIAHFLLTWAMPRQAGRVMVEARVTVHDPDDPRSVLPDASFTTRARIEGAPRPQALPDMPDLAIEVLSPGQTFTGMLDRISWFLAHGSRLVWIVDGEARSVAVFRPGQQGQVKRGPDVLEDAELLPGFVLKVADLFDAAEVSAAADREQP